MDTKFYTVTQIVERCKEEGEPVSRAWVSRLCKRGEIAAIKPGHDYLISAELAEAWISDRVHKKRLSGLCERCMERLGSNEQVASPRESET